jgi:hypothetical protein
MYSFAKEAEACEWEMETCVQQCTLFEMQTAPYRGLRFYLSTKLTLVRQRWWPR